MLDAARRVSPATTRPPDAGRECRPLGSHAFRMQCGRARGYALGLGSPSAGDSGSGAAGGAAGAAGTTVSAFRRALVAPLAAEVPPAMAVLRRAFRRSSRRCRRRRISRSFCRTEGLLVEQVCGSRRVNEGAKIVPCWLAVNGSRRGVWFPGPAPLGRPSIR